MAAAMIHDTCWTCGRRVLKSVAWGNSNEHETIVEVCPEVIAQWYDDNPCPRWEPLLLWGADLVPAERNLLSGEGRG